MIYNLILLLPCAMCLFGATLLICKRESNTRSQNILSIGFLISAPVFICTANYVAGVVNSTSFMWWDILDNFSAMLVIPSMYLYFHSMIHPGRFTWREYLWFAPAFAVGLTTFVLYMAMDRADMEGYIQSVLIDQRPNVNYTDTIYKLHRFIGVEIYHLTVLVQIIVASIFAVLGVRRYHRQLHEFYSDADDKSIGVEMRILRWFLLTIPLSLALIIPDIKFWEEHPLFSSLLFIAWTMLYFILFYYGSQKRRTVDDFVHDLQQADIEDDNYCEASAIDSLGGSVGDNEVSERQISLQVYKRLEMLMPKLIDEQRVYLKSDLRLDEVAHLVFTNRKYVSQFIKDKYHCSFSDYINGLRIDFSMELMRNEPNLTQDKLAEQSGFLNAQSYSRIFKKIVGVPPKNWLNSDLQHR